MGIFNETILISREKLQDSVTKLPRSSRELEIERGGITVTL